MSNNPIGLFCYTHYIIHTMIIKNVPFQFLILYIYITLNEMQLSFFIMTFFTLYQIFQIGNSFYYFPQLKQKNVPSSQPVSNIFLYDSHLHSANSSKALVILVSICFLPLPLEIKPIKFSFVKSTNGLHAEKPMVISQYVS